MKRFTLVLVALLIAAAAYAQPVKNAASDGMAAFIAEASQASWLQIAPDAAADFIFEVEPYVLDVRNPQERTTEGFVGTSVLIPLAQLDGRIDELPRNLDAPIVVYCAVGIRGNFALTYLKLLGYTNVRNIRGGFGAWAAAGMPIVFEH
jgi:rhodanese-related sulfurtransferase